MSKTGFGFLRLPLLNAGNDNNVDFEAVRSLSDRFIELGGNYFDTAYTYLGGNSELAIREAVVSRYPRDKIRIADKLPTWLLKSRDDCMRFFNEQLLRCGVDFFDVYLLHGLDRENYTICRNYDAFAFLEDLKSRNRIRFTGFSFHGSAALLDEILTEHPETDYVQLQINYLDWESESIQSRLCYETAVKHGKKVIVMEPIKGGSLAKLPEQADCLLRELHPEASMASWAMRFAQNLDNVEIVLSGMNSMEQIEDNMQSMNPFNDAERALLASAANIIRSSIAVGCTGCAYCMDGCPQNIAIPRLFSLYNEYVRNPKEFWKMEHLFEEITWERGKPSDCKRCGACEARCPQRLNIIENLKNIAAVFEGKKES